MARDDAEESEHEVAQVEVTQQGNGLYSVSVSRSGAETPVVFDNIVSELGLASTAKTHLTTFFPAARVESTLVQDPAAPERLTVFQLGEKTELRLVSPGWFDKALGLKEVVGSVVAPMPCKILRNEVAEGQEVEKGDPLVV